MRCSWRGGAIPSRVKVAILLPGDAPLIPHGGRSRPLTRAHRESGAAATILSAEIENPTGYGGLCAATAVPLTPSSRIRAHRRSARDP